MNALNPGGLIPERADAAPTSTPAPTQAAMPAVEPELRPGFDPHVLSALFRRNLPLILLAIGVSVLIGLIASLLTTPKYNAGARIQIEQQVERVLPTEGMDQATREGDAERFLQTQTDVLKSRSIAIGVAQSLKLFGNPRFHVAMGAQPLPGSAAAAERERTIRLLQGALDVNLPRNSRILALSFTSRDAEMTAQIANAYAQVFITANLQRKFSSSAYARDFLAGQLVEAKARLEASERELNAYARQVGLIAARPGLGERGEGATTTPQSVTTSSLQQLNDAFNTAKAARIEAEQRWRNASATPVMSLPDVLASPAIQELLQQRATLTADLRQARERYRGEFPALQEKKSQLDEVNNQIAQLAGNIRESIHNRFEVAANQESSLGGEVTGLKQATLSEQDRSVRFTILSREVDTNRTLYDGLLQRYKELSAAAGVTSNNISVVDAAETPLRPSSPRLFFNLALSLLAGVVLATLLVIAREQIDDLVRSPAELERKLQLTPLGVVPRLAAGMELMPELGRPKSPVAEAYSALRSALLYSTPNGLPRSILVTSTQAGEGKSTTSIAIASGFAKLGRRVALVDADLRRPSLHRLLAGAPERGLSDLLIGAATAVEVATPIADAGVWLIPAGPLPPNPTDLLSGGRLPELIRELEQGFDLLVIDGPPVLGLADAPMLAANTGAVLFVIEANRSSRGRTRTAIRRLKLNHARILGALLTKFEARKAGLEDYYGYNYYAYGSGKSGDEQEAA